MNLYSLLQKVQENISCDKKYLKQPILSQFHFHLEWIMCCFPKQSFQNFMMFQGAIKWFLRVLKFLVYKMYYVRVHVFCGIHC